MTLPFARRHHRSIPLSIELAHISQSCSEFGHDCPVKHFNPFKKRQLEGVEMFHNTATGFQVVPSSVFSLSFRLEAAPRCRGRGSRSPADPSAKQPAQGKPRCFVLVKARKKEGCWSRYTRHPVPEARENLGLKIPFSVPLVCTEARLNPTTSGANAEARNKKLAHICQQTLHIIEPVEAHRLVYHST